MNITSCRFWTSVGFASAAAFGIALLVWFFSGVHEWTGVQSDGSSSTSLIQCCTSFSLSSSSNSSEFDRYLGTYRMHKPPSSLSYRVEDSDSVHLDHPLVVAKGGKTFGASWTKEGGGTGEAVVRFERKLRSFPCCEGNEGFWAFGRDGSKAPDLVIVGSSAPECPVFRRKEQETKVVDSGGKEKIGLVVECLE